MLLLRLGLLLVCLHVLWKYGLIAGMIKLLRGVEQVAKFILWWPNSGLLEGEAD